MHTYLGAGNFSCGRLIDLTLYHGSEFKCSVATKRTMPETSDMMPVHESAKNGNLQEKDALYIEFDAKKIKATNDEKPQTEIVGKHSTVAIVDSVTNALMNKFDRYVPLTQHAQYGDHQQFNVLVTLMKDNKRCVRGLSLAEYVDMSWSFWTPVPNGQGPISLVL